MAEAEPADAATATTMPYFTCAFVGVGLDAHDTNGKSDPYFEVVNGRGEALYKSETIKKTLDPTWASFDLPGDAFESGPITVTVTDWDRFTKNDLIGNVAIDEFTPATQEWKLISPKDAAFSLLPLVRAQLNCAEAGVLKTTVKLVEAESAAGPNGWAFNTIDTRCNLSEGGKLVHHFGGGSIEIDTEGLGKTRGAAVADGPPSVRGWGGPPPPKKAAMKEGVHFWQIEKVTASGVNYGTSTGEEMYDAYHHDRLNIGVCRPDQNLPEQIRLLTCTNQMKHSFARREDTWMIQSNDEGWSKLCTGEGKDDCTYRAWLADVDLGVYRAEVAAIVPHTAPGLAAGAEVVLCALCKATGVAQLQLAFEQRRERLSDLDLDFEESVQKGERIGLLLDLDNGGTLTLYKGDEAQGTIAEGLVGPLVPCVQVATAGISVRIHSDVPIPSPKAVVVEEELTPAEHMAKFRAAREAAKAASDTSALGKAMRIQGEVEEEERMSKKRDSIALEAREKREQAANAARLAKTGTDFKCKNYCGFSGGWDACVEHEKACTHDSKELPLPTDAEWDAAWDPVLANLLKRFNDGPNQVTEAQVRAALFYHGGHGGQASTTLLEQIKAATQGEDTATGGGAGGDEELTVGLVMSDVKVELAREKSNAEILAEMELTFETFKAAHPHVCDGSLFCCQRHREKTLSLFAESGAAAAAAAAAQNV